MDLSNVAASPFLCPGSTQSVTRAVHLARLNAAWPNCDQCEWRMHSEGLAERTVQETDRVRELRADGIRRTEFGIRGPYINELDRRTVADLVRVFCSCFHEQFALRPWVAGSASGGHTGISPWVLDAPGKGIEPSTMTSAGIVAGYDGRSSSPDIFVGAVASIREFGLPVIDIGRCTAASILEAARAFSDCSGAIFVTGAGQGVAWTGLDAFDRNGDSLPVIWKDFGIRLQHVSLGSDGTGPQVPRSEPLLPGRDDRIAELLQRLKCDDKSAAQRFESPRSHAVLRLLLPGSEQRRGWSRRLTRRSGTHRVEDFEERYRSWLARWFPDRSMLRVLVRSDDLLIRQRCSWLADIIGLEIIARALHDDGLIPSCELTMTIADDDREFSLLDARGLQIPAADLANQLNQAIRSRSSQVTAHADAVSERFWLTDAGRPGAAGTTEHIRDSLAVLGLLVRLADGGRLTLKGVQQ